MIRKVFRKKISKGTQDRKTLTYKGEKYEIDKWVQCDGCNKWRRTHKKLSPREKFTCESIGINCRAKEEQDPEFITI